VKKLFIIINHSKQSHTAKNKELPPLLTPPPPPGSPFCEPQLHTLALKEGTENVLAAGPNVLAVDIHFEGGLATLLAGFYLGGFAGFLPTGLLLLSPLLHVPQGGPATPAGTHRCGPALWDSRTRCCKRRAPSPSTWALCRHRRGPQASPVSCCPLPAPGPCCPPPPSSSSGTTCTRWAWRWRWASSCCCCGPTSLLPPPLLSSSSSSSLGLSDGTRPSRHARILWKLCKRR